MAKKNQSVTQQTILHYNQKAIDFWEGTKDHDVSQNYQAFLQAIPHSSPYKILDFGCGPGRDLIAFKEMGHLPYGLDGSEHFCKMATQKSGVTVWCQDFIEMDLPQNYFHGIFANASLFHVPKKELIRVLQELACSLIEGGILFSSNPRGNEEAMNGLRYGNYMELPEYQNCLTKAGYKILDHYYRPPGKPKEEQPWLAVVSQKQF